MELEYVANDIDVSKIIISFGIRDTENELIAFFSSDEMGFKLKNNSNSFTLTIPNLALRGGEYTAWLFASYGSTATKDFCDVIDNVAPITILPNDFWVHGKIIRPGSTAFLPGNYHQL